LALHPAGWLSEETADDSARLAQDRLWVVDPLDGTREFVKGIPEYSVAVALVERGEVVLGLVHNPATGDLISAVRDGGALRNGEPIRVVDGPGLLASRSELARGEFEPFEDSWSVRPMGSIQLKLALVAAGVAAATFSRGPKHEWDVCAGALIVAEAGGRATDLFGDPLAFNQPFPKVKGILAGAPAAYARAREELSAVGASERMNEFADHRAPGESGQ
jgi:myo-inositol-1(or 4)-monophosphatase